MGSSPDGEVVIRRAEPEDYEGFAQVFEGASAQSETLQVPFPSREAWKGRLANPAAGSHVLVALVRGRHVGNAGLHPTQASPRRAHAASFGMAVLDEFHRRGVGRALAQAVLDLADGWTPYTRVELTVYSDNAPAIALYKSLGFVEEGLHKSYALRDGRYVDALCMARLRPKG